MNKSRNSLAVTWDLLIGETFSYTKEIPGNSIGVFYTRLGKPIHTTGDTNSQLINHSALINMMFRL